MRFKLDENMLVGLRSVIMEVGQHDVQHVIDEHLCGIQDIELCGVCLKEQRILVTFDHHFNQGHRIPPNAHCGVIWIKISASKPQEIFRIFKDFLINHDPDTLLNHTIKITRKRIEFLN